MLKRVGIGLGAALLLLGGLYVAMAERVEVVVLRVPEAGGERSVRLWVVDDAGRAWLRTGANNSTWLPLVRANGTVQLELSGEAKPYQAVVIFEPNAIARVNALSLEKYGWSEQLLRATSGDASDQVVIRLDPL